MKKDATPRKAGKRAATRPAGRAPAAEVRPLAPQPAAAPAAWQARAMWGPALFLFVVASVVYLNCLPNGFTQDDFYYIARNEQIRQAPWSLFVAPYLTSSHYRPVTMLSWAANHAAGGLQPFGFHLGNLLLHAAVTVLLYATLRELLGGASGEAETARAPAPVRGDRGAATGGAGTTGRPGAGERLWAWLDAPFAAALLFAVHPIHVEAVAAAVGRAELLAAGFVLGAWWLHLRGRPWAAAVCFLFGLLSKESAAVFLALPPLGDWACRERRAPRAYALYVVPLVLYLAMRWTALGGLGLEVIPGLDNPLGGLPAQWRVANALHVAWKYAWLQVFPATLSADYSFDAIPVSRSLVALLPALLGATVVLALWLWSFRRDRRVFVAGGVYLVGFGLTSNVVLPVGTILGERLAYLPSAGLCLLAGLGCDRLAGRSRGAAAVALAVVAAALAARTIVRNRDWQDNLTLYTAAVQAVPRSAKAQHNLGVELMDRGDLEAARKHFEVAYGINPEYPDLLGSLGVLSYRRGDKEAAARFTRQALDLGERSDPNHYDLAVNYAGLLIDLGRHGEALALLDSVVAEMPGLARAYAQRGVLHFRRQEWAAARADFGTVLRLEPGNSQARELLAAATQALAPGATGNGPR